MQLRVCLTFLLPLAFSLGCSAGSGTDECNDGADNDGDGLIDSTDPGCARNGDTESPDPVLTACSDGVDNDGDGLIDLEDSGCTSPSDDDEYDEPLAACSDGIDNDGDGLIDFPNDPGCNLTLKDSEDDDCPSGANCPACANGIDDDDDDLIDYPDDLGCQSASDDSERTGLEPICMGGLQDFLITEPVTGVFTEATTNTLVSTSCGGLGPEFGYELTLTEPAALVISTDFPETSVDTVVYLQSTCGDKESELGCNDDHSTGTSSTLSLGRVEPGTYVLVVDSHLGTTGDFKLQVTPFLPQGSACQLSVSGCGPDHVCRPDGGVDSGTCELPNGPTCTDSGILREKVTPQVGDLEITEWMTNPNAVSDTTGEWFEVKVNADVDLAGLELGRAEPDTGPKVVSQTLPTTECLAVTADSFVLFARSTSTTSNGGLPTVDHQFTFSLFNAIDGIFIGMDGAILDTVTYLSSEIGASTSKDPATGVVCPGVTPYGAGDLGTPRAVNPTCPAP